MKFTQTAFRQAVRENNQTLVWKLTAIKVGHTPTKTEVSSLIDTIVKPKSQRAINNAWDLAHTSFRKGKIEFDLAFHWNARGAFRQYDIHYYREKALKMLRRLISEPLSGYTKVAMFGHTNLYFCSPTYGHADYNKVCTCPLNGPLATDKNGNRYDPQAAWCTKVLELSNRIYEKKRAAYSSAV